MSSVDAVSKNERLAEVGIGAIEAGGEGIECDGVVHVEEKRLLRLIRLWHERRVQRALDFAGRVVLRRSEVRFARWCET